MLALEWLWLLAREKLWMLSGVCFGTFMKTVVDACRRVVLDDCRKMVMCVCRRMVVSAGRSGGGCLLESGGRCLQEADSECLSVLTTCRLGVQLFWYWLGRAFVLSPTCGTQDMDHKHGMPSQTTPNARQPYFLQPACLMLLLKIHYGIY